MAIGDEQSFEREFALGGNRGNTFVPSHFDGHTGGAGSISFVMIESKSFDNDVQKSFLLNQGVDKDIIMTLGHRCRHGLRHNDPVTNKPSDAPMTNKRVTNNASG
jgi:hypothetical protein